MTNDTLLTAKVPKALKEHSVAYAKDKGGLSKMIRDFLIKKTKFKG